MYRNMKIRRDEGVMMNGTCFSSLADANDVVLLDENKCKVVSLCDRLIESAKKVGLIINTEKTE